MYNISHKENAEIINGEPIKMVNDDIEIFQPFNWKILIEICENLYMIKYYENSKKRKCLISTTFTIKSFTN